MTRVPSASRKLMFAYEYCELSATCWPYAASTWPLKAPTLTSTLTRAANLLWNESREEEVGGLEGPVRHVDRQFPEGRIFFALRSLAEDLPVKRRLSQIVGAIDIEAGTHPVARVVLLRSRHSKHRH